MRREIRNVQWARAAFRILVYALFVAIAELVGQFIDGVANTTILYPLVALALLLPDVAVGVRRLHDANHSGWWPLIVLLPLIGWIVLLVWFCTLGNYGVNHYGPDPATVDPDYEDPEREWTEKTASDTPSLLKATERPATARSRWKAAAKPIVAHLPDGGPITGLLPADA